MFHMASLFLLGASLVGLVISTAFGQTNPPLSQQNILRDSIKRIPGVETQKTLRKCPYVDIAVGSLRLIRERPKPGGWDAKLLVRPRNIGSRDASQFGWKFEFLNGTHVIATKFADAVLGNQHVGLLFEPIKDPAKAAQYQIYSVSTPTFFVAAGEFTADLTVRAVLTSKAHPTDGDCNMGNNIARIPRSEVQRILMSRSGR